MSDQLGRVGLAVRAARREHGWSQTVLAEKADLSRPTIARVELGEDVSTATLGKILETLGLQLEMRTERVTTRVALPDFDYLVRVGELAYTVSSLEWTILGDLGRLQSELPESLTLSRLEPMNTAAIAVAVKEATEEMEPSPTREYLVAVYRALFEVAMLRNDVLHARPATHPEQGQRLYRAEVNSGSPTGHRFWIDHDWLDRAFDEINEHLTAVNRVRPPL